MTARVTRVAILGDIHCEHRRLAAALAHCAPLGLDAVLAVGDIVDGTGDAAACCRLLREHGVLCVRGNHDRWFATGKAVDLENRTPRDALDAGDAAWIAALPVTRAFDTPMGPLLLCHGLGEEDMRGVEPADDGYALESNFELQELIDRGDHRVVVNGHTHSRMVRRFGRRFWIVNAGTLKGEVEPGFGLLDLEQRAVRWMEFGDGDSVREIAVQPLP